MEAYTCFAQVYDLFMDNVPYEEWAIFLKKQFNKYGIKKGTLLDLGCGTGKLSRLMADKGYDVIGVDLSTDMLEIAQENNDKEILYLKQDMCQLDLIEPVDGIYSACDSLNYILEEEALMNVFKKVNEFLKEKGLFIFDINTEYKYKELMADNIFAENREEGSFIWENYFDYEEEINEYDLTLYIKDGDGLYQRYEETHFEKYYSYITVAGLLRKAGFETLGVYDDYTEDNIKSETERIVIVARKIN